ncbi:MAG: FlgD immunoglobulin-like domain containing protein, partial [Candidatus Neomarinimicrobiota bacterium]
FVFWHHPVFAFGVKFYQDLLHDTWGIPLYANGCDIIFTGHAHYYVRSKKLGLDGNINPALDPEFGTVQIITGNGGAPPQDIDTAQDGNGYLVEASTNSHGYTELTVAGDTLYLRHILSDGTVFDEQIYTPNSRGTVNLQVDQVGTPDAFALYQNYPNPFNSATTIQFSLQHAGHVSLQIIDFRGIIVRSLIDGYQAPGSYLLTWDGASTAGIDMPSGAYFCRMSTGSFTQIRKLLLLR